MHEFRDICPHCSKEVNAEKDGRNIHDGYFWHMVCLMRHLTQFHSDKPKEDAYDPYRVNMD